MKIRERIYRKFDRKTKDYTKLVSLFEKYKIGEVSISDGGYKTIEIIGPKQTFKLIQTAKPLRKLFPPKEDGQNAIVKEMPLFFVTSHGKYYTASVAKINGASYFAYDADTDELVAYQSSGRSLVQEL